MRTEDDGVNGTGAASGNGGRRVEAAPDRVRELAEACVSFVKRALGVELDYEAETLPILDHYIDEARGAARERPETAALIAHSAGAYLGEVLRRRHPSWWRTQGDDPAAFRIELEDAYVSVSPVQLIADALLRPDEPSETTGSEQLELTDEDRQVVADRLAELPAVSEREFYAPSTRLEVIDIAVDAIRARRMREGVEASAALTPDDYDP